MTIALYGRTLLERADARAQLEKASCVDSLGRERWTKTTTEKQEVLFEYKDREQTMNRLRNKTRRVNESATVIRCPSYDN